MTDNAEAPVHVDQAGRIAIITIDNPPVNAGSAAVRRGLLEAFTSIGQRADVDGVVLIGAGKTFVAGSDLREFDGPIAEPQMPVVLAAIEACPKPVVAALHGNALGGGYEIALACDGRIAAAGASVGLPEVTLGIIPGAGGTQRLPRLVGRARAIELITTGRRVPAVEAAAIGMVDRIAGTDLKRDAIAFVLEMEGSKAPVSGKQVPPDEPGALDAALAAALDLGRKNGAVAEAVAAVQMAGTVPFDEAVARERATFQHLRQGDESAALRHLFFAERAALRPPKDAVRQIDVAGVVGLGLMGAGIAASLAASGVRVVATDRDAASIDAGMDRIRKAIEQLGRRGKIATQDMASALARVSASPDLTGFAAADLAVEAVFEDLAVKQKVFRDLEAVVAPGAIVASNTSYLDIDALAAVTANPERVAGLHFFSPAHIMRPVEIIRGEATSTATLDSLRLLVARMGKLPIAAGNAEGFIGNRILIAYRAQCEFLLEEGAYPEDVDAALVEFGMAMGPFAVSDMAGLDIAWAMRKRRAPDRDPRARYSEIADRLCEAGRLGRKNGAGWYRYVSGSTRGEPDDAVRRIIEAASAAKGMARRHITPGEIRDRALAAIVNEAARIFADGIAANAGDIDLLYVTGYGFPARKGGPLFWAGRQPRAALIATVDRMVAASGFCAQRAPNLEQLLAGATAGA